MTFKEEADITLISYMLQAAGAGAPTICILSNDTDVFVLVNWVWKVAPLAPSWTKMPGSLGEACPIRM